MLFIWIAWDTAGRLENQEPSPDIIPAFETQLGTVHTTISRGSFCGNQEIYDLIRYFMEHHALPAAGQALEAGH